MTKTRMIFKRLIRRPARGLALLAGLVAAVAFADRCIDNFAGNGQSGFSGDGGQALQASLSINLLGIGIDPADNIYLIDNTNMRIRKIDIGTGVISTVAGNGFEGYNGDNQLATSAWIDDPGQVAFDSAGNMYFADAEINRVRKVDVTTKFVTTIAGGTLGYSGDGGLATAAALHVPDGVAIDSADNVYIADTLNHVIRKIDASTGIITTIAGDGTSGFGGDGGPATSAQLDYPEALTIDALGNIYISDVGNDRIRMVDSSGDITTFAGDGNTGYSGDGGPATSASLYDPIHVYAHGTDVYILDAGNYRIRKVDNTGKITTVAGNGISAFGGDGGPATAANLYDPSGLGVDSAGNIYITDYNRVRKVDTSGNISLIAGSAAGGTALDISLSAPGGVAFDGLGNTLVIDTNHNRIRKIDPSGVVSLFAGNGSPAYHGDGGRAAEAGVAFPSSVAYDSTGVLYIADTFNHRIRAVDLAGNITTVAGTGTPGSLGDGGLAYYAQINKPWGLVFDSSDNMYISCADSNTIRRIEKSSGIISIYAGTGTPGFNGDGVLAIFAHLNSPRGLAVDEEDELYIADTDNQRIRRVDPISGVISTVAGSGLIGNSGDEGPALLASFNYPQGVAVDDADNLYIADTNNHRIRVVDDDDGEIEAFAGSGIAGDLVNGGDASVAQFKYPRGVAVDDVSGDVYVADTLNQRVRKVYSCVLTPTPTQVVSGVGAEVYHNLFYPGQSERVTLDYHLPEGGKVVISVLDMRGRFVRKLLDLKQPIGNFRTDWDGTDSDGTLVASGIYVIRFELGTTVVMKKVVAIR